MGLIDLSGAALWLVVVLFAAAAAVIAVVGVTLTRTADRLADVTGLGEAIFGAVLLGGTTSLPGIVTSVASAVEGYPELAVSNAVGGIAAQTSFLAIADITYHDANLEHAAASVENLMQGALLSTLLAIPLLGMAGPDVTVLGIHPVSIAIPLAYVFGMRLVRRARSDPLWQASQTAETREDEPHEARADLSRPQLVRLWLRFAVLAAVIAGAGYAVAQTGMSLADRTGLSETVVGALLTAIATSLPELVTSIAAVRQGALTLAVGGIIGGNSFDVLFVAFADAGYRSGSIYHAITDRQVFVIALTIVLTGILLLGLLRRERSGIGNIGFESFLVIALYLGGVALLMVQG